MAPSATVLRIESVERPSLMIVYWILGAFLTGVGIVMLRKALLENLADILVAWVPLLMGGFLLYGAFVTTRDRLRHGAIVLELQIPVAPGDRLRAKLVADSHLGDAHDVEAEFRCLEVKYLWRNGSGNREASFDQKVLWRSQARFALLCGASRSESDISFELPRDALPTEGNASIYRLEDGYYWEMIVSVPIGKGTSLRSYRIPVHRSSGT